MDGRLPIYARRDGWQPPRRRRDQHLTNFKAIPQRTYGHDHGYAHGNGDVCANPKADANRHGSLHPKGNEQCQC